MLSTCESTAAQTTLQRQVWSLMKYEFWIAAVDFVSRLKIAIGNGKDRGFLIMVWIHERNWDKIFDNKATWSWNLGIFHFKCFWTAGINIYFCLLRGYGKVTLCNTYTRHEINPYDSRRCRFKVSFKPHMCNFSPILILPVPLPHIHITWREELLANFVILSKTHVACSESEEKQWKKSLLIAVKKTCQAPFLKAPLCTWTYSLLQQLQFGNHYNGGRKLRCVYCCHRLTSCTKFQVWSTNFGKEFYWKRHLS